MGKVKRLRAHPTVDSELVRSLLNTKLSKDFSNLAENVQEIPFKLIADVMKDKLFTIIYPNDGGERDPANITINSSYLLSNPFPGYYVEGRVEIAYKNQWVQTDISYWGDGPATSGTCIFQHNDDYLNLITGSNTLLYKNIKLNITHSSPYNIDESVTTAPCRVKVWKIGKIII